MAKTSDFRITLDGSHALVSNVSQHSGQRGDFVLFRDVVTDVANRIIKREGTGATLGSVAGTEVQVIHEYVYTDPSTGAAAYYVLGAIDGGSYVYATTNGGSTWNGQTLPITPTAGGRWFFCNADNRVFAVNGKDAMLVGIQTAANTLTWRTAGQAAPSAPATYSFATNDPPYNTGTISCTQGSVSCTGIGTAWTTGATWVGKHININGNDYVIATVTTGTAMTLTETFKEATGAYAYNIFRGVGDWINPPKYAWAYRNPTTGHLSNVSPVLEVTERDQFGITITVTIAGSAANTTAYNNGYTQIQLFRSARNAYQLVALNEFLSNNNTASAIVYVETAAKFSDTFLTDQLAPFTSNGVPPAGMTAIAFHQDRMWGLTKDNRLRFTPAKFELAYGVAVEAWPEATTLGGDIAQIFARQLAVRASGMFVIGATSTSESLIIQTARGDYSVAGDDALAVRVFPIKTRRSGSFMYSATDFDGDLVSFYRDKRLMVFPSRADLGMVIQDKLNNVRKSMLNKVRLHWYAEGSRNYLLLSVPSTPSSGANDYTYIFDLDKGALVYEMNAGFSAFATVHDSTTEELQLWAGNNAGAAFRLLGTSFQDAGANVNPVIRTNIIRPLENESWSSIAYVHLYVNDASQAWTGRLFIHEQTSTGATDGTTYPLTFSVAPYKSQGAQGKKLVASFTHSKRTKSEAFQLEITFPSQNAALWIEKIVVGFKAAEERVR